MGRSKAITLPPGKFRKVFGAGVVVVPDKSVAAAPIVISDSEGTASDTDEQQSHDQQKDAEDAPDSDRVPSSARGSNNASVEAAGTGASDGTGTLDGSSGDGTGKSSSLAEPFDPLGKRKRWNCDYDRKRWAAVRGVHDCLFIPRLFR